ncbi:hypothetical protein BDN72DRAFT_840307 [Pluteus cervinus]|uniref:Uncharacterized protein n=1 Tax=Pluteus cervinus TaxID=181527 RepID=A0ACD3AV40_9AGAR|nr:hypothetical protein BDN72DRAFT_840307 [Pluteus cervinus]
MTNMNEDGVEKEKEIPPWYQKWKPPQLLHVHSQIRGDEGPTQKCVNFNTTMEVKTKMKWRKRTKLHLWYEKQTLSELLLTLQCQQKEVTSDVAVEADAAPAPSLSTWTRRPNIVPSVEPKSVFIHIGAVGQISLGPSQPRSNFFSGYGSLRTDNVKNVHGLMNFGTRYPSSCCSTQRRVSLDQKKGGDGHDDDNGELRISPTQSRFGW